MVSAAHDADQQRGRDHAPERAEPADHHHHEGGGEDFCAHRRMDGDDRREQHAGKSRKADAERRDRHHVGLERDAERADHLGVLHAGAHHAAERRAVDQEPGERHGDDRDARASSGGSADR